MSEWLDTETKALLQDVPPDKLAPADTAGFTLILLSKPDHPAPLQYAATQAGWLEAVLQAALAQRCPAALAAGLTLQDALVAQFELACCDSAAVFIRDEVANADNCGYLSELYGELSSSEEFRPVPIQVHSVPHNEHGRQYFQQFLGLKLHKGAAMTSHDWFVLGIRLFGVWLLTRGTAYVASFTDLTLHLSDIPRDTNPNSYLLFAAFDFAVAAYFLFGARHLAGVCDGIRGRREQEQDDE